MAGIKYHIKSKLKPKRTKKEKIKDAISMLSIVGIKRENK